MVAADLISRARAGDGDAFRALTELHRRELQVHCYRMLGSFQDAEDPVQDTLLAAWQGLGGFEGRASLRTWYYRIATNRCLNARRSASRRPAREWNIPGVEPPEPTRQVAVLVLRDVLGFHASDVAGMLDSTVESVNSALKQARASLQRQPAPAADPPPAGSRSEEAIVAKFVSAYESADLGALVALLTDDVFISMPPMPFEYVGRDIAARFCAGLFVLTLTADRICAITRFDNSVLPWFGLPRSLPGRSS